ncbi:flagellar hook-associated protein 3 FlgL [Vreelandella songnenensis]|uniref:Flagellar hook-associated protein 3 FlgL n=1 Tax=Vreelandella songnenensis TaxID=1176243 RepID=A0A2T0V354_9GAMM|nr:flagellar hook-associated protein FlgL [Halomonas songnenensis]PRY64602.1 flagellar hook-associated protein 3 FlgL [Halomonas songnenensis]
MRISSVTMFEQSTASMNRQQSDFLKVNQQLASGRKVVNPSDNPQAASRAVGVDQSMSMNEQYKNARVSARNSIQQSESVLHSMTDAVSSAKSLLIQASSDALTDSNRASIASELKGVYETLIGQANAADGNGSYLFGGYKDNAPPFTRAAGGNVSYIGGDINREQQVDASRRIPVGDNGKAVFQSVPSGAGYVATAIKEDNSVNAGSVTFIGPQITNVNDEGYGSDYRLSFGGTEEAPTYTVERFDKASGSWGGMPGQVEQPYAQDGSGKQQISFGGMNISLEGKAQSGDQILVAKANSEQRGPDLFRTLESAIRVLENPAENDVDKAQRRNTLNSSIRELDNAFDNISSVRASAGARLNELDVIDAVGVNRMMNYTQTLSDLVDLDYAEAISEYSLRQVGLQAAQKTFVDMKSMSLFNYM